MIDKENIMMDLNDMLVVDFGEMDINTTDRDLGHHETYEDSLKTEEWQDFRSKVLMRDNFTCQKCGYKAFPTINNLPQNQTVIIPNSNNDDELILYTFDYYTHFNHLDFKSSTQFLLSRYMRIVDCEGAPCCFLYAAGTIIPTIWTNKECFTKRTTKNLYRWCYINRFTHLTYTVISDKEYPSDDDNIIIIDNIKQCDRVSVTAHNIQVHHKYYIKYRKPWQYDMDAVVTLCPSCHKQIHKDSEIVIVD